MSAARPRRRRTMRGFAREIPARCDKAAISCVTLFAPRKRCRGRALPGHAVALIAAEGRETMDEGGTATARGPISMELECFNKPREAAEGRR